MNLRRKHKKFGYVHHYYYDVIDKVQRERNQGTFEKCSKNVKDKIEKLRRHIKLKKKENREKKTMFMDTVFFEFVTSLANNTISKIKKKNMVDYFDIDQEIGHMKLKNCKNFTIKSKITKSQSKKQEIDKVDKITEAIRLNKIMQQIDKGSSTYVDSVKAMFTQTSDFYFDHLRPRSPSSSQRRTDASPDKNDILNTGSVPAGSCIKKSILKSYPNSKLEQPVKNILNKNKPSSSSSTKKSVIFSNLKSEKLKTLGSETSLVNLSAKRIKNLEHENESQSNLLNPTFNNKIRRIKGSSKVKEYQYHKEQRLLNFLSLENPINKANQKELDLKLKRLSRENREFEMEKDILVEKMNNFNPIQTKTIEKYIETTETNDVFILVIINRKTQVCYALDSEIKSRLNHTVTSLNRNR